MICWFNPSAYATTFFDRIHNAIEVNFYTTVCTDVLKIEYLFKSSNQLKYCLERVIFFLNVNNLNLLKIYMEETEIKSK